MLFKRSAAEKAQQLQTDELVLKQNALKQSTKKEVMLALIAQGKSPAEIKEYTDFLEL
jgi:hypothetical protein